MRQHKIIFIYLVITTHSYKIYDNQHILPTINNVVERTIYIHIHIKFISACRNAYRYMLRVKEIEEVCQETRA